MAWIKMRSELFTHPKVVRISSALKVDTFRTIGGLMSVWCVFDAHSTDGILDGYTVETLDDYLRWPGFAAAMQSVNWLQIIKDENGESLVLPEFETHNGQSAKRRAQDADRKKAVRKTSAFETDKKKTREEESRGDLSNLLTDGEKFKIMVGWKPSDHVDDMAKQAGVQITPAILQEFISYWLTRPQAQRTKGEWDKALLQSAMRNKAHVASRPTKASPENFEQKNYGDEVTQL